jgi:hypothetical protein
MNECSFEKVALLMRVPFKINPVHAFAASYLRLVFPRKFFPSFCSTKILCLFLLLPACVTFPEHFIVFSENVVTVFGEEQILCMDIPNV